MSSSSTSSKTMPIPSKNHIALLATPGLGHLIPFIELAKRLVTRQGVNVTIFAVTAETHHVEDELLHSVTSSWPGLINAVLFPIEKTKFPSNISVLTRLLAMMTDVIPTLRSSISVMENKPIALIVDQFGTEAIKTIAQEYNMLKYVLIASNARYLSFNLFLPYVSKPINLEEPFRVPGCDPVMVEDLPESAFSAENHASQEFAHMGLDVAASDGILVNTWEDLESGTLLAFRDERFMKHIAKAPVHPIGPIVRMCTPSGLNSELIKWLDRQPNESVVYVSFGSGGTISTQQTIELAWGLELSKQRFIWVVRPPSENDSLASFFDRSNNCEDELFKYLPDGFLDRTHKLGLVVPMWAPQEVILSHGSIGGFVSHCGWNSTLESIVNGVPIICWPLYAEQRMNATMLVDKLKTAIRPQVKHKQDIVGRDQIAKMVRKLMVDEEGLSIRAKVKELKTSAHNALREGGSSYNALSEVVNKIVG